jgi:Peptidase MA superfamily
MSGGATLRGGIARTAFLTAFILGTLLVPSSFLLSSSPGTATAQSAPTIAAAGVESKFPDHLVFNASAQSGSAVQRIRLRYKIEPDGTKATAEAKFDPANSVTASVALQASDQPSFYLAPGTTITYHWEATDAAGTTAQSPEATFFYNDDRFKWTPVEHGGLTVYYYTGGEDKARQMLSVGADKIAEMSTLLGTTVNFPVKVWIYDSVEDMRPALPQRSATFEGSVITSGIRITSDTVLVLGEASYDTLRHELTHVVTRAAAEVGLGTLPAWLDEGTAVYGQGDPGGFKTAIDRAIRRGNVLSVPSITSSPGDPNKVDIFYGESWSLVSYLVDNYGKEKFAQLYAEIKTGKRIDGALQAVYGFDQNGLEDKWRAANNLPPRLTPEVTTPAQAQATTAPDANTPSSSTDGGTNTTTVLLIFVGTLLLAGLIAAAGIVLARRFR